MIDISLSTFAHGAQAHADCTLNGQPIDCGELVNKAEPFIGLGLGLLALAGIVLIAVFVFWLLMLIHAIQHNSPDRTIWIIVLLASFVTGFALIGAVVYYFAEKKRAEAAPADQQAQTNTTSPTESQPTTKQPKSTSTKPAQK